MFVLACLATATASAQSGLGTALNRGIYTPDADRIGTRGGEQIDLRFYAGLNGVVSNGYQGPVIDSQGNLSNPSLLSGISLTGGLYGVHNWKRARLGMDYAGDLRHYYGDSRFDNSAHRLQFGYTHRPSNRLAIDVRGGGALFTQAFYGFFPDSSSSNAVAAASLIDSRYYGLNGDLIVTYLLSARTSVSFGGGGRYQFRRAPYGFETTGYDGIAGIARRMSARTSLGVEYSYMRDEARNGSFASGVHSVLGRYVQQFGPAWILNLGAGIFVADVDQRVAIVLDPVLQRIFGTRTLIVPVQTQKISPSVNASLTRQARRSTTAFNLSRTVMAGGGAYLTSVSESAGVSHDYLASRRWSIGVSATGFRLRGIGTSAARYFILGAGASASYEILPSLHFVARYDIRHLDVTFGGYQRSPSQVTLGLTFSPGSIPLSLR